LLHLLDLQAQAEQVDCGHAHSVTRVQGSLYKLLYIGSASRRSGINRCKKVESPRAKLGGHRPAAGSPELLVKPCGQIGDPARGQMGANR
jgi:hypothetical protein